MATAGAIWALSAAIVFALGQVFVRKGVSGLGTTLGTAVMLWVGTLTLTIVAFFMEDTAITQFMTSRAVLYFIAAGLFHFLAGWSFLNASSRIIGAARTSAITGITPLFAAILAIIALGEGINLYIGIGMILITVGSYFITTG